MTMIVQLKPRACRKDRVEKAVHLKRARVRYTFCSKLGQVCRSKLYAIRSLFKHRSGCIAQHASRRCRRGNKESTERLHFHSCVSAANNAGQDQSAHTVATMWGNCCIWLVRIWHGVWPETLAALASTTSTVHVKRTLPHNCLTGINYAPLVANKWHLHAQDVYKINASRIVMRMVCTFGDNSVHWLSVHTSSRGRLNCF